MMYFRTSSNTRKAIIGAFLVLLFTQAMLFGGYTLIKRDKYIQYKSFAAGRLNDKISSLEENLNNLLIIPLAISAMSNIAANLDTIYMYELAENYVKKNPLIRNIAVAPGSIIKFVYPYTGNGKALGVNLAEHPLQKKDVLEAIRTRKPVISGPVHLVQGGIGIIIRSPIYHRFENDTSYWGIISLVIDHEKLIRYISVVTSNDTLSYSIRKICSENDGPKYIYGDSTLFLKQPVTRKIRLLGQEMWEIAAVPQEGWNHIQRVPLWILALGNFVSILITFLSHLIIYRHYKLQTLLKYNKQLVEELNSTINLKNKFFSIIAHDLRSPFNALLSLTSELVNHQHELPEADKKQLMEYVNQSSSKLYELSHNLLTWAQTQTKQIKYEPQPENLTTIIEDSIHYSQSMLLAKKIDITPHLPDEVICFCDKNMIGTVVRNLISNAIKFTPKNSTIEIHLSQEKNSAIIAIVDYGIGIPDKTFNNLFRIEKSLSTAGTEGERGTGLGLILCKEFVDRHHGQIDVQSEEHKGTSIKVSLPLYKTD